MRRCDSCDDPAVKDVLLGGSESLQLCYMHAAERQFLDVPLGELGSICQRIGYSVNGVIFVGEAIARAGTPLSVPDVSWAVIRSARERFGKSSKAVLGKWGISSRLDVGKIVFALVEAKLLSGMGEVSLEDFDTPFTLGDVLDAP